MKLKTTETIQREVEITLPAFFKMGYNVIKVIADDKAIFLSDYLPSITIYDGFLPYILTNNHITPDHAITEGEFEQTLKKVQQQICAFLQQTEDVTPELLKP